MSLRLDALFLPMAAALTLSVTPAGARDAREPIAVAEAFGAALAAGDAEAVKALLAPDVLIYESGGQESSRDEYAVHHMKGDMAFLGKAKIEVLERKQGVAGDFGWVATRSRIVGTHQGKPVDRHSTETLVLQRGAGGWRIVHIQWSSRPAKPKAGAP